MANRTGYFTHPDCRKHEMGAGHPECPERLAAIEDRLLISGVGDALYRREAESAPLADIELTCEPSPALLQRLQAGRLDLALVTRLPGQPFAVLRRERFVWAAAPEHGAWLRDPLPVALYEAGDIARRFAVEALQTIERPYRVVCSSQSLLGLIAVAQAGLAVVGLVESCVPPGLVRIGEAEGLPSLPMFDLSLVPGLGEPSRPAAQLHRFLMRELSRPGDVPAA